MTFANKIALWCLGVVVITAIDINEAQGQSLAIKTNALYDVATTLNLAVEYKIAQHHTIGFDASINPWRFARARQMKVSIFQPEYRYWLGEAWQGHFFGAHIIGGQFNVNHMASAWKDTKDFNFEGGYYGIGVSYGYSWMISPRWGIEATLGVGYVRADYDKYTCVLCNEKIGSGHKNYFGPTKAGISFQFMIF